MAFRFQRLPVNLHIDEHIYNFYFCIILDPNLETSMDIKLDVTLLSFEYMEMIRNNRFVIT